MFYACLLLLTKPQVLTLQHKQVCGTYIAIFEINCFRTGLLWRHATTVRLWKITYWGCRPICSSVAAFSASFISFIFSLRESMHTTALLRNLVAWGSSKVIGWMWSHWLYWPRAGSGVRACFGIEFLQRVSKGIRHRHGSGKFYGQSLGAHVLLAIPLLTFHPL